MAWIVLVAAGLFEIAWTVTLKMSDGFSRLYPALVTAAAMALSVWLLSLAMRSLPLGTAYAVWTGIGSVGAALAGIALFGEAASLTRLGSIALIVIGIVGLKLATPD